MSDSAEEIEITLDTGFEEEEDSSRSKTEDLHLYFRQSWSAKVGTFGIFLIVMLSLFFVLASALLVLSYSKMGREFLQGLKILLFQYKNQDIP